MLFLRAVAEHPKIGLVDSLTKQVYEPSAMLWVNSSLRATPFMNPDYIKAKTPEQVADIETFYREQWRLIENWSEGKHLNFEWVHNEVAKEISFWAVVRKRPFGWTSRFEPPEFEWEAWVFEHEKESDYIDRMKPKFEAALDDYVNRLRRLRNDFLADRGSRANHYRWAAERVCLRYAWSKIGRENHPPVTGEAVRKAVVPILKRIGIPDTAT